jgi:hypothetical protein
MDLNCYFYASPTVKDPGKEGQGLKLRMKQQEQWKINGIL